MSVESLLFHPVDALQFLSMEGEISHVKQAHLLSKNQIEIVIDSDSNVSASKCSNYATLQDIHMT